MVTTRKQEALQGEENEAAKSPDNLTKRPAPENSSLKPTSPKPETNSDVEEPPTKKVKMETPQEEMSQKVENGMRETGTTERGQIYFFFRPRVQTDSASSIDDVKNLHMLLVPRPPKFSTEDHKSTPPPSEDDSKPMEVLKQGEDAVPAAAQRDTSEKHYRLITLGKKTLPDPGSRGGGGRKETFWATVTAVGDDLDALEKGLGEKTYKTKTRGTRHDPPARLAARGCYALVNNDAQKPSQEATYLGYTISHPAPDDFGDVQTSLGLQRSAAFVVQVKNPQAAEELTSKHVEYPPAIMAGVFGKGTRGRDPAGLRFAPCARPEMLDYEGTELLLIAVRGGEEGLEQSLGEGRGEALVETGEADETLSVREIFRELWGGKQGDMLPEALNGEWI